MIGREGGSREPSSELERLRSEKEQALEQLVLREAENAALAAELQDTTRLLTEARDRYADLYEFAPTGYVTLTRQGAILEANATFAALLGFGSRTLRNSPFNVLLATTADVGLFITHLRLCRESGSKIDTELRLKRRDGTLLDVQLSSIPTADYDSRSVLFRTAVTDITGRKKAELARDETKRQIRNIMDATPVPIGYLDRELRFVFVNAEYLRKFHLDPEGVLDHHFRDVHGSGADVLIGDRFEKGLAGESSVVESYVTCQQTGEEFYLRVHIVPDSSPGTPPYGIAVVVTDLTDQKRTLDEIRAAKEAADRANQAKSQFLANMSHELRTPMNGLLGMIQLALEGYTEPLAPRQREVMGKALCAGRSLLRILNDILDLSKVEAGTLEIEQAPFLLPICVSEAVELFAGEARGKNVTLTAVLAEELPRAVIGDFIRLRQVLINLIGNALKFTDQGMVQVNVAVADRKPEETVIVFTVTDTGIGVPEDKQDLLFQPFSQVDSSHTRQYGGSGIGLAISDRIVRMMGGRMFYENVEGGGSSFSVVIPFREAAQTGFQVLHPEPKTVTPLPEAGSHRVLVAEDEPMAAEILKNVMEKKGLKLDLVSSGRAAVERWEREPYDLIIMDVQMPEMDGLEATRLIREKERERGGHVPILAMTAYASREEEALCIAAGMDAFISKPLDLARALALIISLATGNSR